MQPYISNKKPTDLPRTTEVLEFQDGEHYFRVILEMQPPFNDHVVIMSQAYEIDAEGNLVAAPNGYPSRSMKSPTSCAVSAIGDTTNILDSWVRSPANFNPAEPGDVTTSADMPVEAGATYGVRVWVESRQAVFQWAPGIVRQACDARVQELKAIMATSVAHSGLGFR